MRDVVDVERGSESLIEGDAGVAVVRHGLRFRALRRGEIALILHHLKGGGRAQVQLLLIGVKRLLRKHAGLHGGVVARARLLQADHGVLHVHATWFMLFCRLNSSCRISIRLVT